MSDFDPRLALAKQKGHPNGCPFCFASARRGNQTLEEAVTLFSSLSGSLRLPPAGATCESYETGHRHAISKAGGACSLKTYLSHGCIVRQHVTIEVPSTSIVPVLRLLRFNLFVGEIAYHFDEEESKYIADIIVYSKYRGKGYGHEGLQLLCQAAQNNGLTTLYDDIAIDNSSIALFCRWGLLKNTERTK